jgi:hypothetical protein
MHVSQETPEQTETRLRHVLAKADLVWHEGPFSFFEFPASEFPLQKAEDALALVRDTDVWSVLKPSTSNSGERFAIFSFHFPDNLDNSGFVGWLASALKHQLGTGVFVICGQNSLRGGIFDYWGVPLGMRNAVMEAVDTLRK